MAIHRTITVFYSVAFICGVIGCDAVTLPGGGSSDGGNYLAVSISDFGGASALDVRNDVVTFKSAGLFLFEDLLENAPNEVSVVVSASDVAFMPDDGKGIASSDRLFDEHHAVVTFRLARQGSDACASEDVIGPLGLTTAGTAVRIAGESLLVTQAAKAIVLSGRFEICAQTLADFDGILSISKFSLQFGRLKSNENGVELCHIPPGDPENRHTITVGSAAADAHPAHGDYLGPG
ncbi:MAG: hypothetical protein IIB57_10765, partial [Planctomycetes bacterium]|nr:hypothetical protein [Planctomycetota bacterium]